MRSLYVSMPAIAASVERLREFPGRTVTLDGNRIFVSVQDDGLGFDPKNRADITEGHFGLDGIRERIRAFRGEMSIESAPGRGTKVVVSLAIQQPKA